jgi:RimJ/RimL family protein N-acetyltransferase
MAIAARGEGLEQLGRRAPGHRGVHRLRGDFGAALATPAALGSLRVGFGPLEFPEIVSFTTMRNLRSRAVMERIGMRNAGQDFEHPAVPEGSALRLHCLYRIRREEWSR